MLCLFLLLAVLNIITLCNSVAINSNDFVVSNPAYLNENVWINCTGHTDGPNEEFEGIELMKDGDQFYMYFSNESNRIRTLDVRGINQIQIETFPQYPGSARIKNPTESVKGKYHCRYWFLLENKFHRWTDSGDLLIEKVVGGPATPPPTLPPTQLPTASPTVAPTYNDTAVINNFDVSQTTILVGDDFSLNCTPRLSANQTLISLTISKEDVAFYNFSDNKVKTQGFSGITIYQISYPKNTTGSVIIKSALTQASGIYKCELTIRTANKSIQSTSNQITVNISNNWSPVIKRFDTPIVIIKDNDFWINCTYNPTTFEKLISLDLSKDGQLFYSYNKDKVHVSTMSSINVYKIITPKEIGCVKIEDAIQSYKGVYRCSVTAQKNGINGSINGTTTSEAFVDFSEIKNQYINNFEAPSKFGKRDDLLFNCSIAPENVVNLTSLTISKDNYPFYAYKSSKNIETYKIPELPDTNQIKINNNQTGVVTILNAMQALKGKYTCKVDIMTSNGSYSESADKFVDYTDEWKPDIYRFYVPDSIKRGSDYFWVNCSLSGLTEDEKLSKYMLTISKDNEVFYNISNNYTAITYPVHGLETYQFNTTDQNNGSVRINNPTIEARGYYNCSLTTTRSGESKTVFEGYFVDFNKAYALMISTTMYFVIFIAVIYNLNFL